MTQSDIVFTGDWKKFEKEKILEILSDDPSAVKNHWSFSHFPGGIYFGNRETWDKCIRADSFDECYLKLKEYYHV